MAQSLFGMTPDQIQEARRMQQQQAINQQAQAFGMFGPLYAASRGLSQTGINALAQGLFPEAQDPTLQRATVTQSIVEKYKGQDLNDPAVLSKMAQEFSSAGQPEIAMQLGEKVRAMLPKPKELSVTDVLKQTVFTIEQIPESQRTPAQQNQLAAAKTALDMKEKESQRKTIGKTSSTGEQVYQEGNEQFVLRNGNKVPYYGSLRKEQETSITLSNKQEEKILTSKSTQAEKTEQTAITAVTQLENARAIGSVLNNAFTGVGSDVVLTIGQVANALGVRVSGTTESEQLDQLLAALTAGQAKSLPGSLSEKELMFLKQAIGTRGVTKETLKATVDRLQETAYTDIIANNRLQKYTSEGNSLNKFDFAKNQTEARRLAKLLQKASPEQRKAILGE